MTCDLFIPRADLCNRCGDTRDAHPTADPGFNATWRLRAEAAEADAAEQRARADLAEDDLQATRRAALDWAGRAGEAERVRDDARAALATAKAENEALRVVVDAARGEVEQWRDKALDADAWMQSATRAEAALATERQRADRAEARVQALTAALGGPDRAAMEIDVAEGRREWDGRLVGSLKSTGGGPAIVDGRFLAAADKAAPPDAGLLAEGEAIAAVDAAHDALHEGDVDEAHEALHRAGAGTQRVACGTGNPHIEAAVAELIAAGEREIPCGHKVADLMAAPGSVTKCGACIVALRDAKEVDKAATVEPEPLALECPECGWSSVGDARSWLAPPSHGRDGAGEGE